MNIRKSTILDIPIIQEIAEEAWRPTYEDIMAEEQTIYMLDFMYSYQKLHHQIQEGILFFIIENESRAIGYMAFEAISTKEGRLHKIYFRPEAKRMGVGSLAIQYIFDMAKSMGIMTIELNVNRQNSAVEFYKKMGFEIDFEIDLAIGNGYFMIDYVMKKNLS